MQAVSLHFQVLVDEVLLRKPFIVEKRGFLQLKVQTGGTNRKPLASATFRFWCPRHGFLVPLLPPLPHHPLDHQQEHFLVLQAHRLPLQCQAARRSHSVVVQSEQPVVCIRNRLLHEPRDHEEVPVVHASMTFNNLLLRLGII